MPTKIYYYLEITTTHKLSQKILKFEQNQNPNTPKGARIITHKTLVFNSLKLKKKKKKKRKRRRRRRIASNSHTYNKATRSITLFIGMTHFITSYFFSFLFNF